MEILLVSGKLYNSWGVNLSPDDCPITPPGPSFDELMTQRFTDIEEVFASVDQIKQVHSKSCFNFNSEKT